MEFLDIDPFKGVGVDYLKGCRQFQGFQIEAMEERASAKLGQTLRQDRCHDGGVGECITVYRVQFRRKLYRSQTGAPHKCVDRNSFHCIRHHISTLITIGCPDYGSLLLVQQNTVAIAAIDCIRRIHLDFT